jgi:hypothetical protein
MKTIAPLFDDTPLGLWEAQPRPPAATPPETPQTVHRPPQGKPCLQCGRPSPIGRLFCTAGHKTAWSKGMDSYTARMAKLNPPPEQREIQ